MTEFASIDEVIEVWYGTVSGPAGVQRDWSPDARLYVPGVQFVQTGERDGQPWHRIESRDQYVARVDPWLFANGFFEHEVDRETRRIGNITHVFSTYESRQTADGPVIHRGVNSIQLLWDGERWWVTAAAWT